MKYGLIDCTAMTDERVFQDVKCRLAYVLLLGCDTLTLLYAPSFFSEFSKRFYPLSIV